MLATLLSLPPAGETSDWLGLAPTGHAAGSDEVGKKGRWSLAGKPLPAARVWKRLENPEALARSLRGERVAEVVLE